MKVIKANYINTCSFLSSIFDGLLQFWVCFGHFFDLFTDQSLPFPRCFHFLAQTANEHLHVIYASVKISGGFTPLVGSSVSTFQASGKRQGFTQSDGRVVRLAVRIAFIGVCVNYNVLKRTLVWCINGRDMMFTFENPFRQQEKFAEIFACFCGQDFSKASVIPVFWVINSSSPRIFG